MNNKLKRVVSLLLVTFMFLGLIPTNTRAAVELPQWDQESANVENVVWKLPPTTKIIPSGMAGPDPLVNMGLSFLGHFTDENGRTVLKGKYTHHQSVTTAVWKHIAFRFDDELYNQVDFENSYIMSKDKPKTYKFTYGPFIGKNEMIVPFESQESGYQRRDFYLVLKDGVTWDDVMKNGGHIVQTRIYNEEGTKVWSKHSNTYKDPDAQVNYNTYTQSFAINNLIENRDELVYGRVSSATNYIYTAASRSVFLPQEGKLRTIYQYTKGFMYSNKASEYKAFRQGFSNDFKKYLKPDSAGVVAKIYIKNHAFQSYGTKTLPIKMENLNISSNGANFVVADSAFVVPNNEYKVVRIPAKEAEDYIFSEDKTGNPVVTIVEYNIDAEKVRAELFKDNSTATSFSFDSAFLEDSKSVNYFEYTTNSEFNIPKGSKVDVKYSSKSGEYDYSANVMFGDNKALDLVYYESTSDYKPSTGTSYTIDKGFKIPSGTDIKILNLEDNLSNLAELNIVITDPSGKVLLDERAPKQTEKFYKAEILQRSDLLSAGILNKTARPLIHEIFTDSQKIDGLNKFANTWVNGTYVDKTTQKVLAYDNKNFVPDGTPADEQYAMPTEKDPDSGKLSGIIKTETQSEKTFNGYPFEFAKIKYGNLVKDMPIKFTAQRTSSVKSEEVVEQVQAWVDFNLNGGNINGDTNIIEKIAPLNKEYSHDLETGAANENYAASGFTGDNLKLVEGVLSDHNGHPLQGKELAKREFPGLESDEALKTEAPVNGTKKFLGWSTKKLTTDEEVMDFADAEILTDVANWADVDDGTSVYKFTETSPIDKERTVYAVYGDPSRLAENMEQSYDETADKQGITGNVTEVTSDKPVADGTVVKLVDKDGNPIKGADGQEITTPVDAEGNFAFPVDGLKHDQEVYFQVEEPNKFPSEVTGPVKLDLQAPTIDETNGFNIVQDPYGYQIKANGQAEDESGILRLFVDDKDKGYYNAQAAETTANLTDSIITVGNKEKTFTLTAIDKFGNKAIVDKSVKAKLTPITIKLERVIQDDDSLIVFTDPGVKLKIQIFSSSKELLLEFDHTQQKDVDEIKVLKDGSPFTLEKGQKIKITGVKEGRAKSTLNSRVR
mgnify:CR=1 FL=1